MLINKTYTSFRREEFIEYFKEIGVQRFEGIYEGEGWEVEIGYEKNKLIGKMHFITVDLTINVEDLIAKEFIDKLRIAFLRGGG